MSARPLIDMDGRHVAIVGAAGELGAAMTALLLDLGAHVLAIDRDATALDAMAGPSRLRTIVADVMDEDAMASAFDGLDAPLDGLVALAASFDVHTHTHRHTVHAVALELNCLRRYSLLVVRSKLPPKAAGLLSVLDPVNTT